MIYIMEQGSPHFCIF